MAADLLNLELAIHELEAHCDGFHIDLMDNHFVPNLTMGPDFVNAISKITHKPVWVHFLTEKPESLANMMNCCFGIQGSVHIELNLNFKELRKKISESKMNIGVALNPKTPIEKAFPIIEQGINHILLMSVEPGFSGQGFLPESIEKLKQLNNFRKTSGLNFKIALDGGINETNILKLAQNGCDEVGIGSGIFSQSDPVLALKKLYAIIGK